MSIDRLYYWITVVALASFCCFSHYQPYNGNFHRPQNKWKKQRRKAEQAAAKKAEKLANELGIEDHDPPETKADIRADMNPGLQVTNAMDTQVTENSPAALSQAMTGTHLHQDEYTLQETAASEPSQHLMENTSQKRASWKRNSSPSPPHSPRNHFESDTTRASPLTSPISTKRNQNDPQMRKGTIPTNSDIAHPNSGRVNSSGQEDQIGDTALNAPQEAESNLQDRSHQINLRKRRASVSPEKLNTGRFKPLVVRTNLPGPTHTPSAKRSRIESQGQAQHNPEGELKNTDTFDAVSQNISPSATLSTSLNTGLNIFQPCMSESTPARHILTPQLFNEKKLQLAHAVPKLRRFSLLQAFVNRHEMCLLLVSYLTIPSLIDLYAISKPFHYIFNQSATAFILSSMRTLAPKADQIFPWRCYQSLCVKDPVKKQKDKPMVLGADISKLGELSRDVPSLRWLQMVAWREGVVKDMIIQLATKALLNPTGTADAVKRMWFILDLPLNAHRIALIRNPTYISKNVLFLATHFFLKVDMSFTDPGYDTYPANHPNQTQFPNRWAHGAAVGCNLREKLIAERSLTPLWRVLHGWNWDPADTSFRPMRNIDALRLWARHRAVIPPTAPDAVRTQTVMGMKVGVIPIAGYERIYTPTDDPRLTPEERRAAMATWRPSAYRPRPLLRPDELIMGECVRRRLKQHLWWCEMMLWGFVTPDGRDVRTRTEAELSQILRTGRRRPLVVGTKTKLGDGGVKEGKGKGEGQGEGQGNGEDRGKGDGKGKVKAEQKGEDETEWPGQTPKTPATAGLFPESASH